MRLPILLAAFTLTAPAAAAVTAESWVRVGGNANSITYVDAASIRISGDSRDVWVWVLLAKPLKDSVWSARVHYTFDCAAGYYRSLDYVHYGAGGEELSNHPSTTSAERRYPEKGAVNETMFDFVCKGEGGLPVSDPKADAARNFAAQ